MQICKCCSHPRRADIDQALVDGKTFIWIASKFSRKDCSISKAAVQRHRHHVLPKEVIRQAPPPEPEAAKSLVERIEGLMAQARSISYAAESQQQWQAACSALREVRGGIELLGKLTGQISATSINFNNFNFALLSEAQTALVIEGLVTHATPSMRQLLEEKFNVTAPPPRISVNFKSVIAHCPQCGYEAGSTQEYLPPAPGGNGHA